MIFLLKQRAAHARFPGSEMLRSLIVTLNINVGVFCVDLIHKRCET